MTKIYGAQNKILIYTDVVQPEKHSHMAAHIIVAEKDKMHVKVGDREMFSRGIVIPADTEHYIDSCGGAVLVFLYDSSTTVSKTLNEIQLIREEECAKIIRLYHCFRDNINSAVFSELEKYCIKCIEMDEITCGDQDERILAARKYIKENLSEELSCKKVAEYVYLSESRFSHLFKKHVGVSLWNYVIYKRLNYFNDLICQDYSINEACLMSGFQNYSNFFRLYKKHMNITPSEFKQKNIKFFNKSQS